MGSFSSACRAATLISLCGFAGLSAACTTAESPQAGMGFAQAVPSGGEAVGDADAAAAIVYDDNIAYPGRATYACDDGQSLTVDNSVTAVRVALADGSAIDMPASPPDSHNRYVAGQYALVLDGEEALYMRPKTPPATCRTAARQASID